MLEIELFHFGFNHAEAARHLIESWQLPPTFGEICRCDRHGKAIDPTRLAGIAEVSCEMARALGFPAVPDATDGVVEPSTDQLLLRVPERLRETVAAQFPAITDMIPLKLNLFEQEFFH